jgi:hypothetical protein
LVHLSCHLKSTGGSGKFLDWFKTLNELETGVGGGEGGGELDRGSGVPAIVPCSLVPCSVVPCSLVPCSFYPY